MLQDVLIAHGVCLKVAAFSCHHATAQGEEAGFKVLPLESDLKKEWCVSLQLHRGLWLAAPSKGLGDMLLWLIDTFSFPLNTKPLVGVTSLSSALNLCRARDKRRNVGWSCVSTINGYKQQTSRVLGLVLLSKKIIKIAGFELTSCNYSEFCGEVWRQSESSSPVRVHRVISTSYFRI